MHADFRALLLTSAEVSAILGNRINWKAAPQGGVRPYAVLHFIGQNNDHHMAGADDLKEARVQVSVFANTYSEAIASEAAIRRACDGHSGGVFQGIFHAGSRDGAEGGTNEAGGPFSVLIDFLINWSE